VGGGILNYTNGEMILTNSTVSGNSAFDTGGIANLPLVSGTHSNHVKLINSTVSNNDSFDGPGGISNIGTLRLTNSTVSGNKGATGGMGGYAGGIHNFTGAMVELINCTISDNSTSHHVGAGVGNPGGVVTLINTIVAGNLPAGDCYSPSYSPITSLGHNLDSDGTCNLTATGDIPNTNPLLGSLQDNGGPTETHALQSDSPAIDAGDDSACPDTDQRGVIRPLDGDGDGTATCDIGAYEFEPPTIMVPIDIKPGSDPNSINCNNKNGVIPVAILTTEDFDATAVDHTTVAFEGAGEMHVDKKSGNPRRHEEDVDGDGDIDLVFHFRLRDTGLTCDSTEGTLTGETFGQAIEGTDAVRMIDKGGGKP
jgi:hypothetical protein